VYNSDLLTYSGVQTRPSHVFTFYTHACTNRRFSFPSGSSGGHSPEGSVNERSAVTFGPEGDPFTRRFWSSSLRFWAAVHHLRPNEGDILRHRRSWSLSLRFWAAIRHLRPTEGDILRLQRSWSLTLRF